MQKKFNDYVVDLRQNQFDVAVYDDELNRHFQKEADYIAELNFEIERGGLDYAAAAGRYAEVYRCTTC